MAGERRCNEGSTKRCGKGEIAEESGAKGRSKSIIAEDAVGVDLFICGLYARDRINPLDPFVLAR